MSKVAWLVGLTCPVRQSPNGDPGSQTPSQVESRIAACVAQTGCVAWLFRMRHAEASRASSATMRRAAWPQEIVPRGHQDRQQPQRCRRRVARFAAPVAFPAFPARLSASIAAGDWRAGCTGWMGSGGGGNHTSCIARRGKPLLPREPGIGASPCVLRSASWASLTLHDCLECGSPEAVSADAGACSHADSQRL